MDIGWPMLSSFAFLAKFRLVQPEYNLLLLSTNIFIGSKYPVKKFNFETNVTDTQTWQPLLGVDRQMVKMIYVMVMH